MSYQKQKTLLFLVRFLSFKSDRAGARTQDPLLKREMLYQLSYQVIFSLLSLLLAGANIVSIFNYTMLF